MVRELRRLPQILLFPGFIFILTATDLPGGSRLPVSAQSAAPRTGNVYIPVRRTRFKPPKTFIAGLWNFLFCTFLLREDL